MHQAICKPCAPTCLALIEFRNANKLVSILPSTQSQCPPSTTGSVNENIIESTGHVTYTICRLTKRV
ncbi:hypothetical protein FRX31_004664 [Thalictrum thalictroides]|uniref:Uncharacterized protein n=1 Tax=Thalictrum thalictroides TaxID=46969 RepID=A0A7J6X7Z6_THATH|nr:hypothetical protein FRX31_004664 [Thalictrum thalictroides]